MDVIAECRKRLMEYENIIFAYVFGSYASGKVREDSDIDIAIYLKERIDKKDIKVEKYIESRWSHGS
jgi:predicted nucleotidyltransferase